MSQQDVVLQFVPWHPTRKKTVDGSHPDFAILQLSANVRRGDNASEISAEFVDYGGRNWADLRFNDRVRLLVEGEDVVQADLTSIRRRTIGPGVHHVTIKAQGLARWLYGAYARRDWTFTDKYTSTIAHTLLQNDFYGLGVSKITTGKGKLLATFEVEKGESLGSVFERLRDIDGFEYWVEDDNPASNGLNVFYEDVNANPTQGTITDEDLREPVEVEDGTFPPRNRVRLRGTVAGAGDQNVEVATSDTLGSSLYDALDSKYDTWAQSFTALAGTLKSVNLDMKRTQNDAQNPLRIRVFPNAMSVREDATITYTTQWGTWANTGNATDGNRTTYASFYMGEHDIIFAEINYDFGSGNAVDVDGCEFHFSMIDLDIVGLELQYSDDGSTYFTAFQDWGSKLFYEADDDTMQRLWTTPEVGAHRYWRFRLEVNSGAGAPELRVREHWLFAEGTDTTRYHIPAGVGGHRNIDSRVLPNGELNVTQLPSFIDGDTVEFGGPVPTEEGKVYWLVLDMPDGDPSTDSTTNYWDPRIQSGDPYTGGRAKFSYGVTNDDWNTTTHDLKFRLTFHEEPKEFDKVKSNYVGVTGEFLSMSEIHLQMLSGYEDFPTAGGKVIIDNEIFEYGSRSGDDLNSLVRGVDGTEDADHGSERIIRGGSCREYGVWTFEDRVEGIASLAVADEIIQRILDKHADPGKRVKAPLTTFKNWTPAAPVVLALRDVELHETLEVSDVEHELMEDGVVRTTVTAGTIEYDAARALTELRKG